MSLKDRFNTANSKNPKVIELEEKIDSPKYYNTSEEAKNAVSLGVIDTLLEDDDINAIFVNGPRNIFIERKTKLHRSTVAYRDEIQLQNIIKKHINSEENFVKFNHRSGINVTATLPPLTDVSTMYVKCYKDKFATFEHMEEQKILSKEISMFLQALMKCRNNILIAGDKKTLKTSLLSALAKKAPSNNRYVNIDFAKEIEIEKPNFTNFDLSNLNDKEKTESIVKAVFLSNPGGIFLNNTETCMDTVMQNVIDGFKGVFLTVEATSKEEAIEKTSVQILKNMPHLNIQSAKELVYKLFDFIIFVENKEDKRISSISEILSNENKINDVFLLDENFVHYSTGYTPEVFLDNDIDSININIFDSEYKHTYPASPFKDIEKRGLNPEILKKFRKDLNPETFDKHNEQNAMQESIMPQQQVLLQENMPENANEQITETVNIVYDESFAKKAQDKLDEVRRNLDNYENNQS